jgi:hypothetical protein
MVWKRGSGAGVDCARDAEGARLKRITRNSAGSDETLFIGTVGFPGRLAVGCYTYAWMGLFPSLSLDSAEGRYECGTRCVEVSGESWF